MDPVSLVESVEMRFREQQGTVTLINGASAYIPLEGLTDDCLASVRLVVGEQRLLVSTLDGTEFSVRMDPRAFGFPHAAAPPAVYLDHLHWASVGHFLTGGEQVNERDRGAMELLVELARAGRICLPICASRVTETTRVGARWRREVARAQVELSDGWRLQHYNDVRLHELRGILDGTPGPHPDSITLGAPANRKLRRVSDGQSLDRVLGEMSALAGHLSVLLEDVALPAEEGKRVAGEWAERQAEVAAWIATHGPGQGRYRQLVSAVLYDLQPELTTVVTERGGIQYLHHNPDLRDRFQRHLPQSPALAWWATLLTVRLRNSTDRWEGNDLLDMISLSLAASCCDVVVGERKTANLLRQVGKKIGGAGLITHTLAGIEPWLRNIAAT